MTIRVTDNGPGTLSDTDTFLITVEEDNTAPVLTAISDQSVTEGDTVQFTATATDADLPTQTLTYSLDAGAPVSATINPTTGNFTWTTTTDDGPGTYPITIRVTDDGPGALANTTSFTVTVNEVGMTVLSGGSSTQSESSSPDDPVFVASDGIVRVAGTDADDLIELTIGTETVLTVNGVSSTLPSDYDTIEIDGGTGTDTLSLVGSTANESIVLRPEITQLTGDAYRINAVNFESVTADGGGGTDVGRLYGTKGADQLTLGPGWGHMTGQGYSLQLDDIGEVHGIGKATDGDTAEMFDSPGDDMFIGKTNYSKLIGDDFYLRSKGFSEVTAKATAGGTDQASLVDADGDDLFVATPMEASMTGTGYSLRSEGFEAVHGYARSGGDDVARLYDSPGDDTFKVTPEYAKMIGDGYLLRAKFFEQMLGYSGTEGNDLARFYDSNGDDTYTGAPTYAWLSGDNYFLRAKEFDHYRVQASEGNDNAQLFDSALDDLLEAEGKELKLSTAEQSDLHTLIAFDQITANSQHDDDDDKTDLAATLDFLLTLEGSWE